LQAIENGAWTILEGFSLVTRFARQAAAGKLLKEIHSPPGRRHQERNQQAQSDVGAFEVLLSVRKPYVSINLVRRKNQQQR
jgi:hypothetical protein